MDSPDVGSLATGPAADATRLGEARAGDRGAFEEVARSLLPDAWRLSVAIVGDGESAAAAVEHAFAAAWRGLPRLRDPGAFETWFQRILVSECRMQARLNGHVEPLAPVAADPADGHGDDPDALPLDGALAILDRAFARLDPEDRAIVVLHHLEGRAINAIADTLHMPAGTAKWRLHEALAALHAALDTPR